MKNLFLVSVLSLVLVGCGAGDSVEVKERETTTEKTDSYIGLSVEEAQKKATRAETLFRVVEIDSEPQIVTEDYRIGRINASVVNGKVDSFTIEGQESTELETVEAYDQNSWKSVIPETCQSFFDGCNICNRGNDGGATLCTKKFCQKFEEPKCRDKEVQPKVSHVSPRKTVGTSEQPILNPAGDTVVKTSRVLFPKGKEVLEIGQTYTIAWESEGIDLVNLELHEYGRKKYTIAEEVRAYDKTYTWVPTKQVLGEEQFKRFTVVTVDSDTGKEHGESPAPFILQKASEK